jgi:hypothetical protein
LSFGPSPALHAPAHIPICTGECAWVTNQNPAQDCRIIYCRDPKGGAAIASHQKSTSFVLFSPPGKSGEVSHGVREGRFWKNPDFCPTERPL